MGSRGTRPSARFPGSAAIAGLSFPFPMSAAFAFTPLASNHTFPDTKNRHSNAATVAAPYDARTGRTLKRRKTISILERKGDNPFPSFQPIVCVFRLRPKLLQVGSGGSLLQPAVPLSTDSRGMDDSFCGAGDFPISR